MDSALKIRTLQRHPQCEGVFARSGDMYIIIIKNIYIIL